MPFEEYQKSRGRSTSSAPLISLRKSGGIGINGATAIEYFEGKEYAVLYFDEEENRVGIKPVSEEQSNAYKLQGTEESDSLSLNASGFMNEHQLTPEVTTRYNAQWHNEEELVYIDLDEPVGTYGTPDEDK